MKTKRLICLLCVVCLITPVFAKQKVKNPGKNQIVIVGKINVVTETSLEFLENSRSVKTPLVKKVNKEKAERGIYVKPVKTGTKSTYEMPFYNEDQKLVKKFKSGQTVILNDDEYFILVYDIPQNRVIDYDSLVEYKFFGSDYSKIYLPLEFSISIPYNVEAIYIGEINYKLEDISFAVKEITHTSVKGDIYEYFEQIYKNKYDLVEVEVFPLGEAVPPEEPVVEEVSTDGNEINSVDLNKEEVVETPQE